MTMTGQAEFNEVFFTDVRVPADQIVGQRGEGWMVANATLTHERGMLGDPDAALSRLNSIAEIMQKETVDGAPTERSPGAPPPDAASGQQLLVLLPRCCTPPRRPRLATRRRSRGRSWVAAPRGGVHHLRARERGDARCAGARASERETNARRAFAGRARETSGEEGVGACGRRGTRARDPFIQRKT